MKKLTEKQEFFCVEYLIDFNATQAAIRAGYSENTARVIAAQNLSKLNIQKRLNELKNARIERTQINADYLLEVLKNWLESDITETFALDVENLKQLPKSVRQLIKKYKRTTVRVGGDNLDNSEDGIIKEVVELSFVSKEKAADMLAKHIGFYEKNNVSEVKIKHELHDMTDEQIEAELKRLTIKESLTDERTTEEEG